ncbi:MAG: cupin domain-containing protein [Gammaproteobacteria bacterium]|nr:cupin domain-containing protein [Gammaproteobacteria bacterium]
MFVKNIRDCAEFTASDGCQLRELLHSKNDPVDLDYSIASARVLPGRHSYRHRLKQGEVYYILDGEGVMHIDEEHRAVNNGDLVYIPPEAVQWIENTGDRDLVFLALVSPPWNAADDIPAG